MKIGELATKTGMAASAIRFYEQSGLLPAAQRGANGYRRYTEAAVERIRMIQLAQNLGFTLDAMRSVSAAAGAGFSKEEMLSRLDTRLAEIEQMVTTLRTQHEDLRTMRSTLKENWAIGECVDVATLSRAMSGKPAAKRKAKARIQA